MVYEWIENRSGCFNIFIIRNNKHNDFLKPDSQEIQRGLDSLFWNFRNGQEWPLEKIHAKESGVYIFMIIQEFSQFYYINNGQGPTPTSGLGGELVGVRAYIVILDQILI